MSFVTVVGAGPVGLQKAIGIKRQGFEVEVLEEHKDVGEPVACTGLIQKKSCDELRLDLSDCIVNQIRGARIFSPGRKGLEVCREKAVANLVDRAAFDKSFLKKAEKSGVPVYTSSKLIDIRKESLFIEAFGRGELRKTKIVVGADGAHSVVRNIIQPETGSDKFIHGIQVNVRGSFDREFVEVHFGSFAPRFFAWVTPESREKARVGLGAPLGSNLKKLLEDFAKIRGIDLESSDNLVSGLIPVGPPLKTLVKDNILLVGDAAYITKATTGGGLMLGLKSANVCAETVADHLKKKVLLAEYDKRLNEIKKDLNLHWKIYDYIHSLRPEEVDRLFWKAKKAGLEDFLNKHGDMDHPSKFVGKAVLNPRLWGMLGTALRILM